MLSPASSWVRLVCLLFATAGCSYARMAVNMLAPLLSPAPAIPGPCTSGLQCKPVPALEPSWHALLPVRARGCIASVQVSSSPVQACEGPTRKAGGPRAWGFTFAHNFKVASPTSALLLPSRPAWRPGFDRWQSRLKSFSIAVTQCCAWRGGQGNVSRGTLQHQSLSAPLRSHSCG